MVGSIPLSRGSRNAFGRFRPKNDRYQSRDSAIADDAPALAFEKRTQSGNGIYETSMRWAHKREHRELEAARHASLLDEQLR